MQNDRVDCAVIGAGVVGLAVGRALSQRGLDVAVVEAADAIGTATSSRNSEVVHAGIYYPTGSLKARLCVEGRKRLYVYCVDKNIRHRRIGKLIVAGTPAEVPILDEYFGQAQTNGVDDLRWVEADEARALEPEVNCERALLSPTTGIIDAREFMLALQADLEARGGLVVLKHAVTRVGRRGGEFELYTHDPLTPVLRATRVVNSAGLHAQQVAGTVDGMPAAMIPPCYYARGHYWALRGKSPFGRLVYPVSETHGIGIHVTLDLAGTARFGPDVQWIDSIDYTFDESNRERFVRAIRQYYPALDETRLQPAYTGVRPKISGPDEPPADFMVQTVSQHGIPGLVHLFGLESPGLTAALGIGDHVAELLA